MPRSALTIQSPPSRWLCCALALASAGNSHAAALTVRALQHDGKPLFGAVVTADAESPVLPHAAPIAAIMDQMNLAFVPDVLVVPVHSTVRFPNSDSVSHQVYSFSSARQFQLPLYRGKPYPPVTFDTVGVVTLGCNIHDNMLAYIVVTAAPFYGRTDARGEWLGANVPNGRYRIHLWHPLLADAQGVERVVEVGAATAELEIRLEKNLRPAPLKDRPHSWDY